MTNDPAPPGGWITVGGKRVRAQANPRVKYAAKIRLRFGISLQQYDQMILEQEGRCRICQRPMAPDPRTRPCVDHCHLTGRVRGVICYRCNAAIGLLCDDPLVIRAAADYLEE